MRIIRTTVVLRAVLTAALGALLAAPAPAAAAPTAEDLRPALLTTADLPQGFVPLTVATAPAGAVSLGGDFPGCPGLAPVTGKAATAAAASFAKGFGGPYLTHAVVRLPAGAAVAALDRVAATVTSCKSFTQDLAGITVRFQLTAAAVPATLGHKAVGVRVTGRTDFGISVTAEVIAVRRGDLILWLNDTTIGTAPAGIARQLAQAAVNRCAQRVKGC